VCVFSVPSSGVQFLCHCHSRAKAEARAGASDMPKGQFTVGIALTSYKPSTRPSSRSSKSARPVRVCPFKPPKAVVGFI